MSYPRNAASPERIAIGAVVQISDGAVQSSGVTITVRGQGGAEGAGAGTTAYGATGVVVYYTPTQGETDFTSFVVIASKTGCIPVAQTIVTSASATAGYSGLDWSKVTAPTTTLALTGTTIATTQKVDIETIKTNPVVNAGTITFPTTATLASTTNITAGTITTATNVTTVNGLAANVITAASMAADASAEIADQVWDEVLSGHLTAGTTGAALNAAGSAGDPWSTAIPGAYGAGTAGKILGDNINATISSRASQTSVDTVDDFLDTEIAAIKAKTDLIPSAPAAVGDIPTATQNADALLNRDMSAVSDTNARSPLNALRFIRNKWDVAATTLTVKKEDDTTTAWTATVATSAGADPIVGNDPA